MDFDLKIFRMDRLCISQNRIAKRLGATQQTISNHLPKMAVLPNLVNADLKRGFTVPQVAEMQEISLKMLKNKQVTIYQI